MEANCTRNLTLSILVRNAVWISLLECNEPLVNNHRSHQWLGHTLFSTAIDAYELPRLIPTTSDESPAARSMGASALPFCCVETAILSEEVYETKALQEWQKTIGSCRKVLNLDTVPFLFTT